MSEYITPVMFTDSTGMSWLSDLWDGFVSWFNTVPDNDEYQAIDTTLMKFLGSFTAAIGVSGFSKYFSLVGESIFWIRGNPLGFLSGSLTFIGGTVTVVGTMLTLDSIWRDANENTNGERLFKSLIEISSVGIQFIAINLWAGVVGAAIAAGTLISAPVIIATIGVAVVCVGVYYGSQMLYDHLNIE